MRTLKALVQFFSIISLQMRYTVAGMNIELLRPFFTDQSAVLIVV